VPWQIIVGPKSLADGKVEVKRRSTGERQLLALDEAAKRIAG
jgi:prolyl-tRNA synthetase